MADQEHLKILKSGVEVWNRWREENPRIMVNLRGADLVRANLVRANLMGVNLSIRTSLGGANLLRANLSRADLSEASLIGANLMGACLTSADLSKAYLGGANLVGAYIRRANLSGANLSQASLSGANLTEANLSGANLSQTNLSRTNLTGADLNEADLREAVLTNTDLTEAILTGCLIYGISAWKLDLKGATQTNLVISNENEPSITVDNLEVAQFIYLLLHNEKIRQVIDTITAKSVLILGRFTPERKAVLDAIRAELRRRNYVPIMFDFDRPTDRDFTETIMTLAGLCRFIIADITNPRSSPLELQAAVPNYMVPLVPIIQAGERPFAMFRDLAGKYDWVLAPLEYRDEVDLVEVLEQAVIAPALAKYHELLLRKAQALASRITDDYR